MGSLFTQPQCAPVATVPQCCAVLIVNLVGSLCKHHVCSSGHSSSVLCGVDS